METLEEILLQLKPYWASITEYNEEIALNGLINYIQELENIRENIDIDKYYTGYYQTDHIDINNDYNILYLGQIFGINICSGLFKTKHCYFYCTCIVWNNITIDQIKEILVYLANENIKATE